MTSLPTPEHAENCRVCRRDLRRQPSRSLPQGPCPRCSEPPELEAITESGRLAFVDSILPELQANSMEEALCEMVSSLVMKRALTEQSGTCVLEALAGREQLTSTEPGCGIAIAYARYSGIDHVRGAFARSEAGLETNSQTGRSVNLVFLVVSPASRPADHLCALQAIARYLKAFDRSPPSAEKSE